MGEYVSMRARWAQSLVALQVFAETQELERRRREDGGPQIPFMPAIDLTSPHELPTDNRFNSDTRKPKETGSLPEDAKVCIVGAGAAGLYLAMLLDSIDIKYDILESSDRTGGRMYTHLFGRDPHDYYDVGAMRYPNIHAMKRTFDLFKMFDTPLVEYFMDGNEVVNCPSRFNDVINFSNSTPPRPAPSKDQDPYHIGVRHGGNVPNETLQKGASKILKDTFDPYKNALRDDWDAGFKKLMEVDYYSTRQYLREERGGGYDFYSIQWLETQGTSSGLFDQAFTESVIDSFDFDSPKPGPNSPQPPIPEGKPWYCILGGTKVLARAMEKHIKGEIEIHKRVNRIWIDNTDAVENIHVQVAGESGQRKPYAAVFNTTSLGCLQRMDLTGLDLHPTTKDAIRCLHYDNSCKVAIKFKYPWWIEDCGITSGGVASTDLPLRTCVYPSYNLEDKGKPAVLLCSYTWAQDAVRMGSLISRDSPNWESELLSLMFDNLARLHLANFNGKTLQGARDSISKAYVEHHAYDWTHDPNMSGAFALFGPGQFSNYYTYLTRPAAQSKFFIVGEASSAHHAWIAGALDSAMAACLQFLNRYQLWDKWEQLKEKWGDVAELDDSINGSAYLQIALGMQKRGEHVRVAPAARLSDRYF